MQIEVKRNKKWKISNILNLIIFIVSLIFGIIEAGLWGLLVIPYFIFVQLVSLLGLVPFIGPILYFISASFVFNSVSNMLSIQMPISTGILLWSHLGYSLLYSLISTLALILAIKYREELRKVKK